MPWETDVHCVPSDDGWVIDSTQSFANPLLRLRHCARIVNDVTVIGSFQLILVPSVFYRWHCVQFQITFEFCLNLT